MKYENKEVTKDAPFNMASLFYVELHILRKYKSKAFIEGELFIYRDALEEIHSCISFKLTEKENKNILELFNTADKTPTNNDKNLLNYRRKLRNIDMQLTKVMDKYKMIFPNVEMNTGLSQLYKQYDM